MSWMHRCSRPAVQGKVNASDGLAFLFGRRTQRPLCSLLRASCNLFSPNHSLPSDVDPNTGMCAGGTVRIGDAAAKGLGAFAVGFAREGAALGDYRGELLTSTAFHMRYGSEAIGDAAWQSNWEQEQYTWKRSREQRGVGVTGRYVYKNGSHPKTGALLFIDAEDPEHANWTRFLNHASPDWPKARRPNLNVRKWVRNDEPTVTFIAGRDIHPDEELLFDYGRAYFEGKLDEVVGGEHT